MTGATRLGTGAENVARLDLEPRHLMRLRRRHHRWLLKTQREEIVKIRKIHYIMRRSKRLAAKKDATFSETEGSSQEEPADITSPAVGNLVLKTYDDIATVDDGEDVISKRIWMSSQEEDEPGRADEFLSLPTEFKSTLKE